jgi:hypothetical protein
MAKLHLVNLVFFVFVGLFPAFKLVNCGEIIRGFYGGRIPPGKFEYPKHNGWLLPKNAVKICENDLACGGFTFRGAFKVDFQLVEVYFFHFVQVPSESEVNYYHWSSYRDGFILTTLLPTLMTKLIPSSSTLIGMQLH